MVRKAQLAAALLAVVLVMVLVALSISVLSPVAFAAPPAKQQLTFDFKDTDIHDVLRVLGSQQGVSIVADPSVSAKVTMHVDGVDFEEGLRVLLSTYGFSFTREGSIYRVFKPKIQPFTVSYQKPAKPSAGTPESGKASEASGVSGATGASVATGTLTVQATGADVSELVREITAQTGQSVVVDRNVRQTVTVNLTSVAPEAALKAIAEASGLTLTAKSGYLLLGPGEAPPGPGIELLQIENGLITARIKDTDLNVLIRELSNRAKLNIIADRDARGTVSGTLTQAPLMSGLATFFEANGLALTERNGAWMVRKAAPTNFTIIKRDDNTFDLNINGADLVQVLRELADRAKVSLVVNQYVRAQASSLNVTGVTLEEAFEYVLSGTNFTFRRDGSIYIIGDGTTPRPESLEFMQTRVIRLQYVAAETVPSTLPPSIPANLIKVVKEQNAIVVTATPEIADRIEKYLGLIDVPGREISAEVIRPKYVRVEEILPLLAKYYPPQTLQQLKDLSGVIVSGTPETVGQVKDFIAKIDQPSPLRNELIPLKNLKAEDVQKLLPPNFDKNSLLVLTQQNAVVATGSDGYISELRRYLTAVDVPTPQILFDVVVVEYSRDSGVTAGTSMSGSIGNALIGLNKPNSDGNPTGLTVSVDEDTSSLSFSATLNALVQKGKAKVLANPKLTALSGESSTFNVISKSYYWDPQYDDDEHSSSGDSDNTTTTGSSALPTLRGGSPRSIDTGIKLRLKPWVSGSGDITIDIEPSVSDSVGSDSDLPKTNERSARTTVRVKDGQTVIIGGLIQTERHESSYRVPVLSSIPFLGALFKSRNDIDKQAEFVIYITPYLVTDGADIARKFSPLWTPGEVQREGAVLAPPTPAPGGVAPASSTSGNGK